MRTKSVLQGLFGTIALAAAPAAFAVVGLLDLTAVGSSGTINNAQFVQINPQSTGTGVINSFVEIGGNDLVVEAFNTTVNGVLNNGSSDIFNHELALSSVPIVTIGGVAYRQFLLDINQQGADPLLTLDEMRIYQSGTANFASYAALIAGSSLRYDLDGAGNSWVLLDYNNNTGSGSGDMFAYIRNDAFGAGQYVYLYSKFGATAPFGNNDGFEEWAVLQAPAIPEPETYALMLAGLAAVGFMARRRRQG